VSKSDSQPVFGLLSQSPQPELHVIVQLPTVQDGVPLAVLQTLAHDPQFWMSRSMLASQPLALLLSQSTKPALHVAEAQVPARHTSASAQTLLHEPQLFDCASKSASQPSSALPLQSL
jgi:hypothetical protein